MCRTQYLLFMLLRIKIFFKTVAKVSLFTLQLKFVSKFSQKLVAELNFKVVCNCVTVSYNSQNKFDPVTSNLHLVIKLFRRYLHQQWDKKTSNKKRSGEAGSGAGDESKKPRLETLPDTSNTGGHVTSRTSGLSFSHGPGQSGQSPSSGSGHVYPGTSRQSDNRFANQQ